MLDLSKAFPEYTEIIIFLHLFYLFFTAIPTVYGNSQARGRIGAATACLLHSYSILQYLRYIYELWCSLQQCWILNPLSKVRDPTCKLIDYVEFLTHWATTGTPSFILLMWYITLTDLQMLNHPCSPGINPTWSWCNIFCMH